VEFFLQLRLKKQSARAEISKSKRKFIESFIFDMAPFLFMFSAPSDYHFLDIQHITVQDEFEDGIQAFNITFNIQFSR